jgi:hypothetical protein
MPLLGDVYAAENPPFPACQPRSTWRMLFICFIVLILFMKELIESDSLTSTDSKCENLGRLWDVQHLTTINLTRLIDRSNCYWPTGYISSEY